MSRTITRLLLLLVWALPVQAAHAKDKTPAPLQYSIQSSGSGQQGYWVVEVTAHVAKKADIGTDILMKCAVHGALFKGVAPGEKGGGQKPLCPPTAESQHADFFNAFFVHDYLNYASVVDGTLEAAAMIKGYEVTATVQIAKDSLRQAMEQAGVVRKLGF